MLMIPRRIWPALLLCFMPLLADASTPMRVGLSWSNPTERVDGSPLAPGELELTIILCAQTSRPQTYPLAAAVPAAVTSVGKLTLMAEMGLQWNTTYFCALRSKATDGTESHDSTEVSFHPVDDSAPVRPETAIEGGEEIRGR